MITAIQRLWRRHDLFRDTLQTLVICYLISLVIWLTDAGDFWLTLQVALVFGVSCLCAIRISIHYLENRTSILVATVIGYLVGVLIGTVHLFYQIYGTFEEVREAPASDLILKVLFSLLVTYVFYNSHRLSRKRRELQAQRMRTLEQEKQLAESNYQVLQSRIEPHFLFNTLANIRVLIDVRPETAKTVLDDLTGLLRGSMTKAERQLIPLSEELEFVKAYLSIQRTRMGGRLSFEVVVQDDIAGVSCPPFTLQPLVENSVIHGIEPKLEGGHIRVLVDVGPERCCVTIRDTGLGLRKDYRQNKSVGHGIAVDNIHQRLALLYGTNASLILANQTDAKGSVTGCVATVRWPVNPEGTT
ncbi:MAG: hypothetical protein FH752_09680 [Marinobacter adhaerens]|uniref:Signal transduction histidine kinase internal region domain-containing protein n=1 Tax=Marinobacter adhaerens TaxID=1033846 RepID=A0A844HVB2_9GAMM|nr:hypothetical protein [Marinobacter adhaerens]